MDDDTSAGPGGPPAWRGLYNEAVHQGSDWQTQHHYGQTIDTAAAKGRYEQLQQRLTHALSDPDTPDEARLPLATAGYQLFTGANIAGIEPVERMPPSAIYAAVGAMAFSGGGGMAPRGLGLRLPEWETFPATGNRTAVAIPGRVSTPASRSLSGLPEVQNSDSGTAGPRATGLRPPDQDSTPPAEIKATGLLESPSSALTTAQKPGVFSPRGVTNAEVGRLPAPARLEGISRATLGKSVVRWGTGPDDALERANTLTTGDVQAMQASGFTRQMAEQWRVFYVNEYRRNANNLTALNRVTLMQRILELWPEHPHE